MYRDMQELRLPVCTGGINVQLVLSNFWVFSHPLYLARVNVSSCYKLLVRAQTGLVNGGGAKKI